MARKPSNLSWVGFTKEQSELLHFIDHLGNNGWDRNGQTSHLFPGDDDRTRDVMDAALSPLADSVRTEAASSG